MQTIVNFCLNIVTRLKLLFRVARFTLIRMVVQSKRIAHALYFLLAAPSLRCETGIWLRDGSGPANLHTTLNGTSGHYARLKAPSRKGVLDVQDKDASRRATTPQAYD
jgi:hypothetical protein